MAELVAPQDRILSPSAACRPHHRTIGLRSAPWQKRVSRERANEAIWPRALRPALAVVVFAETHHAQGHLWHDVEADEAHLADMDPRSGRRPGLVEVYEEVDRQIGRLMEANDGEAPIVFSVTGNRAGRGHG